MVKKNTLLFLACIVWSAAGFNILKIGIEAYPPYLNFINVILSLVVFLVFQIFIFGKLVKKHTKRISQMHDNKHFFMKFFDVKSFVIMAVMMSTGIFLRSADFTPEVFIAVFYAGLGSSLLLAGILFGKNYLLTIANKNA